MHANEILIARFYDALGRRDADTMAACYQKDVVFSDPVFGELRGERVVAMWRMLVGRAKDLAIEASGIEADDHTGRARWVATYTFAKTGRRVRNVIDARFEFREGLIARHADSFDLWKWSGMALGPTGRLLGWTPMLKGRVRAEARDGLDKFLARSAPR